MPGPLQGADGEWIAELLDLLQAWILDLLHQGLEQLSSQGQRGPMLLFGVITGPGGHLRIELKQFFQKCLVAAGRWVGTGAE
ncbi:MAG: Uncharacterised protein [Synechococcus sp. CC9902]|nr:MAG: Uncharacterised protein [Synechococcus sp. CC9902]